MENAFAFSEDLIHFFKVKPVGLWEEEIHTCKQSQIIVSATAGLNRKHGRLTRQDQKKVGACEDQEVPPPNGRERGRRNFGHHETMKSQWK